MKKALTIFMSIILLLGAFTLNGCSNIDDQTSKQLKDDTFSIYEEIKEQCQKSKTNEDFFKFVEDWSSVHDNLATKRIGKDSIIITKEASFGNEDTPSTMIQSSFQLGEDKGACLNNAISLAVLKNINNHGKVFVLLTAKDGYNYTGATVLPEKYLDVDNIINLDSWSKTELIVGSASTASYRLSSQVSTTVTSAKKAYKIEISGCSGGTSADRSKKHPNPLSNLGKFLSGCKSGGMSIELASFQGGDENNTYPTSVKAVVVVHASEESKFISKLESSKESFLDTYEEVEPEITYTIEEAPLPETLISNEDTDNFLSLMYTLEDGVYGTDDSDNTTALSTIAAANLTEKESTVLVMARSIDSTTLEEMNNSFKELASLSDYSFEITGSSVLWEVQEDNSLVKNITAAAKDSGLKLKSNVIFKITEGAILNSKNPDANIVSIGTQINNAAEISQSLYTYLKDYAK